MTLARWSYVMAVTFAVGFLTVHFGRQTAWYKNHLYRQLLSGDAEQRLRAAGALALVGGEQQLLDGLKRDESEVSAMALRGLDHLWASAAGPEAFDLTESAFQASEREQFDEALRILDGLVAKYPEFAEGWNRRAAVLWQTGQHEKSMADCLRALALNPNHFGAWQGLGICHLQKGDVDEACRSLRVALQIAPHDEATRKSLERCEEFLRSRPAPGKPRARGELL
jgi:tetratricopeptide (TPR) repeat protein